MNILNHPSDYEFSSDSSLCFGVAITTTTTTTTTTKLVNNNNENDKRDDPV
jgi:hypothetical protein